MSRGYLTKISTSCRNHRMATMKELGKRGGPAAAAEDFRAIPGVGVRGGAVRRAVHAPPDPFLGGFRQGALSPCQTALDLALAAGRLVVRVGTQVGVHGAAES